MARRSKNQDDGIQQLIDSGLVELGNSKSLELQRISTGIEPLDAMLDGGYALGKIVMIYGPESTGKTVIAQLAAASVQRTFENSCVLLLDVEHSYIADWWSKSGVDLERLYIARPATAEQASDLVARAVQDPLIKCIILDSVAAMTPAALLDKATGERIIAPIATVMQSLFHKFYAAPESNDKLLLLLNQMRVNLNGYEDAYPGGWVVRHNSHVILRTRRESWIKEGDKRVGFLMSIYVKKSKISQPEQEVVVPFLFDGQVDEIGCLIDAAMELGIIKAYGPYYEWRGAKVLGRQQLREHIVERSQQLEQDIAHARKSFNSSA